MRCAPINLHLRFRYPEAGFSTKTPGDVIVTVRRGRVADDGGGAVVGWGRWASLLCFAFMHIYTELRRERYHIVQELACPAE